MTPSSVTAAASWTVASRIVATLSQFASFILVARIVGPAVLGVFAIASAVALGFGLMAAAGWRQYAAAHPGDRERLGVLHATAGLAGLVTTAASLIVAGVAAATGAAVFATFLAVLSVGMAPQALGAAFAGRLISEGRLAPLARASMLSDLLGLAAAGWVLALGGGVWALPVQRIVMLAATVGLTAHLLRGRDAFPWGRPDRHVFSHAATFLCSSGSVWAQANGPLLLVGGAVGAASAGLFRAGSRLVAALAELANEAAGRLALARFGSSAGAAEGPEGGSRFTAVVFAVTAPAFVGLALVAEPVVALVLGAEWRAAAPVIAALSLGRLLGSQVPGIIPTLTAARRFRAILAIQTPPAAIAVAGAVLALPFGVAGVVGAVVVAQGALLALKLGYASSTGHLSIGATARMGLKPALAVAGMAAVVVSVGHASPPISLALKVASGAVVWAVAIALLYPRPAMAAARAGARKLPFLRAAPGAPSDPEAGR